MIVNEPVFDRKTLKRGSVISAYSTDWSAIENSYERIVTLTEVEPLQLKGYYYNPESPTKTTNITIKIDDVLSKKVATVELVRKQK